MGWSGETARLKNGDIVIHNPRPFHGAPKGAPDLWGFNSITVDESMVGKTIAVAVFEEVKANGGRLSGEQKLFKAMCNRLGAVFRVIRE
jgi:hypothetical protein